MSWMDVPLMKKLYLIEDSDSYVESVPECIHGPLTQRSTCLSLQYIWVNNHVSSRSVLEQDTEPVRLKKSEVEGGSLSPERRKRQPKQTQISCALLRRQGAEHGVLVDATKPLKTNLPPSLPPSYLSYPWHTAFT